VPAFPLLLASTSPQRRAILEQLGLPFRVEAPAYEEDDSLPLPPVALVETHARGKARSVERGPGDGAILAVDTTVALDGDYLGKPVDAADAQRMVRRLGGREHVVTSGLALRHEGLEVVEHAQTVVRFRELAAGEAEAYVALGEWQGRAGGYAIQGRGAGLVEEIEGDYLNVVGLPAALLMRMLLEHFPADTVFPSATGT
jgi:nucleoside triphosphate pyrophosphatase